MRVGWLHQWLVRALLTHQFWSVVLSILTLLPPRYILVYACSRSTISKKDQKTRTLPSSYSFSVLSVAFHIEHIFFLFYSIFPIPVYFFFSQHLSMSFFPVLPDFSCSFLESIREGAQQEGEIRGLSTPQHPRKKKKKHRITAKTVDETPTTLI